MGRLRKGRERKFQKKLEWIPDEKCNQTAFDFITIFLSGDLVTQYLIKNQLISNLINLVN